MIGAITTLPAKREKEYFSQKDTGCEYSRTCLECPRPVCKHDDPHLEQRELDTEVAQAYKNAQKKMKNSPAAIHVGHQYGVEPRGILRIVQRVRER